MTALYNELDPFAAAWLRELIREGHIRHGEVDGRSIVDLRPADMAGHRQVHLFAGIGVWSYALRRAGWSDDRSVWTASFPCQPFSAAGKRRGTEDERHLWPVGHALIRECRPRVVIGEQISSPDGLGWFDTVQSDMEEAGYACWALDTCAAGVGAPHIRQRLYWCAIRLADADDARLEGREGMPERPGQRAAGPGCVAGGMADADSGQCDGIAGSERSLGNGAPAGREQGDGGASGGGVIGGVADNTSVRRGQRQPFSIGMRSRDCEERSTGRSPFYSVVGDVDRPGPTNGIWRDADWLGCRDGKWRPVEASPQPLVDGVAESLGRVRDSCIQGFQEEINAWSVETQSDRAATLRALRVALGAQTKQVWAPGRLPGLHEAPFLLALLCQFEAQGWAVPEGVALSCSEAAAGNVRMLRDGIAASGAPCERRLDGQQSGKSPDPVHLLSSLLARHAQAAWGDAYTAYAEIGFPLGHGSPARVGRLRGYGNALNAEQATVFVQSVMGALDERRAAA